MTKEMFTQAVFLQSKEKYTGSKGWIWGIVCSEPKLFNTGTPQEQIRFTVQVKKSPTDNLYNVQVWASNASEFDTAKLLKNGNVVAIWGEQSQWKGTTDPTKHGTQIVAQWVWKIKGGNI